ncbi:hypothetical protein [Brucella gallinifaecis]|uniref:hypothetical protein n=1 Tax=Brucella gallinifaecis TaxID=215590 RepID=UPI0023621591|nr:hypothetical protein [Brucella gallinifaecis]
MFGAALSRWTLSYVAASLFFLSVGMALMAGGFGYPFDDLRAPETLIVVHIIAIGWLSLLMCGALLQFVPVLVAKPLQLSGAELPALLFLLTGLCGLIASFAVLAGIVDLPLWLMPLSALFLIVGFAIIIIMLGKTIWIARPLTLPARFVVVGLVCLLVVVVLGSLFTLMLSSMLEQIFLMEIVSSGLSTHVILGLGGWMTFTAMGVSYRLLSMFMLAPEPAKRTTQLVLAAGVAALALLAFVTVFTTWGYDRIDIALMVALALGVTSIGLYVHDVHSIYGQRKRKNIELNSAASVPAFAAMLLSLPVAIALPWVGTTDGIVAALVYLFTFGWLTGLSLAQLYKIVPFLTWLECYGPVMGKILTPRVQDIVVESRAKHWFWVYYTGVAIAIIALIVGQTLAFRVGCGLNLVAILALSSHFIRARRLMDVPEAMKLPNVITMPHLIYAGGPVSRGRK